MENTTTPQPVEVSVSPVTFNGQTTFQSPFFWIVVGAAVTLAICHYMTKRKTV